MDSASASKTSVTLLVDLNRQAESLPHWKRLLDLDEKQCNVTDRLAFAWALVQSGDYMEAATQVEKLTTGPNSFGELLYDVACVDSVCPGTAPSDDRLSSDKQTTLAETYVVRALDALRQADATCHFKASAKWEHFKQHPDFAPLRAREDFLRLLRSLEERSSGNSLPLN